ncbi:hypothetical protein GCM10022197_02030 [Microlunatus spumicola]|uniref:Membrane proteinase PrsW, cleaves anti-sigma factor RsiW, M82 family n=1 Tax=Microlunatus spumicola TaxID=81499 RepID=A0ABP6WIT8_9ACTN
MTTALPEPGTGASPAAPPTLTDVAVERLRVVRESGWGAPVRFVQPRNAAFWVYVALVGFGLSVILRYLSNASVVYGTPITVAVVLFALYGGLFWWFTQHIDRYAHLPRKLLVIAFFWGGFGAIIMASYANSPILSLLGKAFGLSWASDWGAGIAAPIDEELAKGLGLLLLIALASRAVSTAFDGFILGAFIGLGFQIVEDLTYAVAAAGKGFGADPSGSVLQLVEVRAVFGLGAHIAYSAIFCTGLVLFLGRPGQPRRVGAGLGLMLTAMLLHGVWDNSGGILGPAIGFALVAWVLLTALTLVIVVRVFRRTVGVERAYMRAVLAPEVESGTITAEEAGALAGDGRARRAYRRVAQDRGRRRLVLMAAHDLADELGSANGAESDRVRFARDELARVRSQPV